MTFLGMRQTGIPGIDAIRETLEREFTWGQWHNPLIMQRIIWGGSRDTGNTGNTTVLRPGLAMGTIDRTPDGPPALNKMLKPWTVATTPTTDGSQLFTGFLLHTVDTQVNGSDTEQLRGWILCAGAVKSDAVCLTVETSYGLRGATDETAFRALDHVTNHIVFDDFDIYVNF